MLASVARRTIIVGCVGITAVLGSPSGLAAQGGRTALDERLDALATERAQALIGAQAEYERALEELRARAEREDDPQMYAEGQPALSSQLELQELMIELDYQTRRADILEAHIDRGAEDALADDGAAADAGAAQKGLIATDREEMSRLNDELARAWAEFHERAQALRERVRQDDAWEGYEAAVSELEAEYEAQVARIEREQRLLRMRMAREQPAPESDDE